MTFNYILIMRNNYTRTEYKQIMSDARELYRTNYEEQPIPDDPNKWLKDGIFIEMSKRLKKYELLDKVIKYTKKIN